MVWPLPGRGDGIPAQCVPYAFGVHEWCVKHDVPTMVIRGYLDENRNQALLLAKQEGFTHVAMLDADHKHPANVIERLWQHVQDDPTRLVVAGMNMQSAGICRPMFGTMDKGGRMRLPIEEWFTSLVKCDWAGLCSCIISVDVMKRWPKPWFWFDYDKAGRWTTEDINFCTACYEHGVPIWVDTTLVSPHRIEEYADVDTWRQKRAAEGAK